jgi:xanthine dehydrogenase accessory factor
MKLDHLAQILAAQAQKRPIALATRLADGAQSLYDGVTCTGAVALSAEQLAEAHGLLAAGRSASLAASQGAIFLRSYAPPARLVVIGAVHIAQFLAPMAALAGFEVIVIDPRQAFASEARFPGVTLVTEWPGPALARIGLDDHTAVVTLTHDPKLDDPALCAALQSPVFYIGALGSTRTHAKRIERLREHGLAQLAPRIHAPVGLDLGGRAAAEIAVSVLAQVIQERYRRAPG